MRATFSRAIAYAFGRRPELVFWLVVLAATVALFAADELLPWAVEYPSEWVIPLRFWVSDFMKWLINEADLGLFTFKQFTRSISWVFNWFLAASFGVLSEGVKIPLGGEALFHLPSLSWIALIAMLAIMAYSIRDWALSLLVGICFLYLAIFGQWGSAMVTLSSIVVAVPLGILFGLLLGILAYRHPWFERAITPLLDLMQTVPVFAYLVPVLFMFGFGPVAAMTATMIYSLPPMTRCTTMALQLVPTEIVEFGNMAGCSHRQLMWKVMVPSARPTLMVGVNQVIMLSLNMVIIASMIGAGGLGFDVLHALRRLAIGVGLEAGVAITVLAIALDRLSQAYAGKAPVRVKKKVSFVRRHPHLVAALAIIVATTVTGFLVPAVADYPESLTVTTSGFWEKLVTWINIHFFDTLDAIKSGLLLNVLIPFKRFLLSLPWLAVMGLLALAGVRLGGWRLSLGVAAMTAFVAVTGNWEKAMISTYLIGVSVVLASGIGMPIGIWAAGNDRVHRAVQVIIDTLQTLPAFVYLIPVVMLFRVGDFSAMIAVVAYSLVPIIRYTDHGIRQVPPSIIEAATAAGCTHRQILLKVQMPLALPEIMLGVNQTIMLGLSMLVITALVGTRDLGQEVYIALTKADTGRGIVAGVCVAMIAMVADRLISAWSTVRKKQLGLS
ncbi:MAG: ABC transporter permease subunit [Proteobacteria bacterium]|nr:ABC transporter permease subunit [Pseudomonadota bacterium]NIS72669.1 ABC transporter permease subunit [Pseudomonadota bacterium]